MTFGEYQEKSKQTAKYPICLVNNEDTDFNAPASWIYPTLGLVGEAGEVAEKLKKIIRNHNGIIPDGEYDNITKELGDVLWYLSALCTELGIELNEVAETNVEKLQSRLQRNVIKSEGDDR